MRYARLLFVAIILVGLLVPTTPSALTQAPVTKPPETVFVLKPAHIFDGESAQLHDGWVVMVRGEKIEAVGSAGDIKTPAGAKVIELPGMTLMPGLIDRHSNVLLHPYSNTCWYVQGATAELTRRVA